jgi:uncharacterized protein YjbI with pentapeptide repeats
MNRKTKVPKARRAFLCKPPPEISEANLNEANLSEANLSEANL